MSDGFIQASHRQSKHCPRVMCGQNMAPSLLDEPQGSFNDAKDPHMRPYTESAALGLLPTGDTHQLGGIESCDCFVSSMVSSQLTGICA